MKLYISKKYSLLYLLLSVLIYESIVKYIGVSWNSTVYSNVVTMQGKTIPMLKYVELALILFLCFSKRTFQNKVSFWAGFLLLALGIFWCLLNLNSGLTIVYLNTSPVLLVEMGCIYLFLQDQEIRKKLISLCGFLAVFFTALTLIDLLNFLRDFSLTRMANGNVIEHYANALFLLAVWNCFIDHKSRKVILLYGCSIGLLLMSVFITSRGWMFQAVILLTTVYMSNSQRNIIEKLKRVTLVLGVFVLVYLVIVHYMDSAFSFILNRMGDDTRTSQLVTFFGQVSVLDLLVGRGPYATYVWNGVKYAYVDNIFLFWMYRYGAASVLAYWMPFLYGLFSRQRNSALKTKLPYNVMILMWMMAMGGLCIYYNIRVDIANIYLIMCIVDYIELKNGYSYALRT